MSKGLGKTQQFVLDRLMAKGRALSAVDLAGDTYFPEYDTWEWKPPTPARVVSVRRAINGLTERGLIKSGLARKVDYGRIDARELFCWLSDQSPPNELCRPMVSSEVVEKAVIDALNRLQSDEHDTNYNMRDGFYRYESFTNIAIKLLAKHYDSYSYAPERVAIKRAVTKLFKAGQIDIRWRRTGINGWIRLSVAQ